MKIPAALHPANHFHVQCLLLHAGLCADGGLASQNGRRTIYQLARSLALSRVAFEDHRLEVRPPSASELSTTQTHTEDEKQLQQEQQKQHPPTVSSGPPASLPLQNAPLKPMASAKALPQSQWREIAQLLQGVSDCLSPLPLPTKNTSTTMNAAAAALAARKMAFTPPSRLMALHAPRALLPPLPHDPNHDDITYDAAMHHVSLLSQLLAPYGFTVALIGEGRRGCPLMRHASFLLSLTEEATEAAEAVREMQTTDVTSLTEEKLSGCEVPSGANSSLGLDEATDKLNASAAQQNHPCLSDAQPGGKRRSLDSQDSSLASGSSRRLRGYLHREALTLPMASTAAKSTPTSAFDDESLTGGVSGHTGVCAHGFQKKARGFVEETSGRTIRTQPCSRTTAFAAGDVVSPQVAYRTHRAVQHLCQLGYVVAGHIPLLTTHFLARRQPLIVSARYDTLRPTQVPPCACVDPTWLAGLQLHHLHLHFCPWPAQPARQLFLTGPPAFAAHVTLRALAHGVDLNMNGAFACVTNFHTQQQQPQQRRHCTEKETTNTLVAPVDGLSTMREAHTTDNAAETLRGESNGRIVDNDGAPTQPESFLWREDVDQVILGDEDDIFEIAGMPRVDPLLRGVYCQMHYLE